MKAKRALLLSLALITAAAPFSCGRTEQKTETSSSERETAAETTAAETSEKTTSAENKKDGKGIDLSFGMLGYVKKSKKSSANANASTLYKAICTVLTDKERKVADNVVYSHTESEDELNKTVRETYFNPEKDLEYIMSLGEDGFPEWIICSCNTKKDDYVGVFGNNSRADELREMNWAEVLKVFGYEQGEYSEVRLEKIEPSTETVSAQGTALDLDDPDVMESCMLASTIGWEYNRGISDMPLYLYGKWSKDTPFTADFDWEVPQHGDIEFILEMYGRDVGRVLCWDTARDKKYVGDSDMGYGYNSFAGRTWDEVLEYFGYKQGEYVDY